MLGLSGTALAVTKSVITAVVATLTIAFLTLFMLLEGPAWVERFYALLPGGVAAALARHRRRRSTGRSAATSPATSRSASSPGVMSTLVLLALGVPYAVALGLLVAILDLIPLAGATIAAVIVTTVALPRLDRQPGSSSSSSSSSTSSSRTTCCSRSSTGARCSSRRWSC